LHFKILTTLSVSSQEIRTTNFNLTATCVTVCRILATWKVCRRNLLRYKGISSLKKSEETTKDTRLRSRSRGGYLSARLLHCAMRILLVNEFMRRPECTVKSNVTRHSWHTASPPRKTSQHCTGLGIRHPEDVCRNISISGKERERERERERHAFCSILLSSITFMQTILSVSFYACVLIHRWDLCAVSHLSILAINFLTISLHPAFWQGIIVDMMGLSGWDYIVKFANRTTIKCNLSKTNIYIINFKTIILIIFRMN